MKTIENLDGDLNLGGAFDETAHICNAVLYEHPDLPGHFIPSVYSSAGLKFYSGAVQVAINFEDLFALVTAKEPNLLPQLADVEAGPDSGVHPQDVTLTHAVAGVSIRYTLDGSEPTEASTLYAGPVNVAAAATLKAKAFKANWRASNTASFVYT